MICPYCGAETVSGKLRALANWGSGVVWKPVEPRSMLLAPGLVLSDPAMSDEEPENGYCMRCHVLLCRPKQPEWERFEEKYKKRLKRMPEGDRQ